MHDFIAYVCVGSVLERSVKFPFNIIYESVMKMAGDDWRKSRYFPRITSFRVLIRAVQDEMVEGLALTKDLAFYGAELHGCGIWSSS
jgi:hypothetical protein